MLLLLYWIPFVESRFYWLPFVKNICTKSTANNYLPKVNNKSTRTSCELCSKLTTKISGRCHCSRSDVFIFTFEHCSCLVLKFLWLILNKFGLLGGAQIFKDTIFWNNCYTQTWRIYRIKSLSYHVLLPLTNRINSQLFFIVIQVGFKEIKIW